MVWRRPGDKPLSEPMMVSLLTHICVTRPQWVKVASHPYPQYSTEYVLFVLNKFDKGMLQFGGTILKMKLQLFENKYTQMFKG